MAKRGAPSKFTPDRVKRILASAEKGRPRLFQARAGGVHMSTLMEWKAKGEAEDAPDAFKEFSDKLREADAKGDERLMDKVDCIAEMYETAPAPALNAAQLALRIRNPSLFPTGAARVDLKTDGKGSVSLSVGDISEMSPEDKMAELKGLED